MMKWLLGLVTGLAFWGFYNLGAMDMKNTITYTCRDYGKFMLDEEATWEITCVGPFNPMYQLPEYRPYPQELKDKYKRNRK